MIQTSEIIIGCMLWSHWGKNLSQIQQTDLLEFCVDQGNTTFDHADIYGDYTTEGDFGIALKNSSINRNEIQLISKCGIQLVSENRTNSVKHYNYSKSYIIWSAERSLKALQTDYLDLFLLHRPSPLMHPESIAEAVNELKSSGKILNFGVSNFTDSQTDLIAKHTPVAANQIEFSLTNVTPMLDGNLDYMHNHNIKPLSWSPLGKYFKSDNPQNQNIKAVLKKMTKKYNASEDTLLLSWILKHPSKITPVIGTTVKERIKNSNLATRLELDLEDWFLLLEASQGQEVP